MAHTNGRVAMRDSCATTAYSPASFVGTNGIRDSTTSPPLDDKSVEELDRIMDTLNTLTRDAARVRDRNHENYALPSPEDSLSTAYPEQTSTSFTKNIATVYPTPVSPSIPPPTTSPPQTPMQHQRNFTAHPKIMTLASLTPKQSMYTATRSDARNPATMPRLPANPYENTSILHGCHVTPRANAINPNLEHTNPFPLVPDSPYVNKHPSVSDSSGMCFFGNAPLPANPEANTGPPRRVQEHHNRNNITPAADNRNRNDLNSMRSFRDVTSFHRPDNQSQEAHTLPAYNEKRSYLKNLEEGTLPRPRVDSVQQLNSQNTTPATSRKHQQKPSLTEDTSETLSRLSLRRPRKVGGAKRAPGKFNAYNLSKSSSRHSTTSFNSYDLGRNYASVSTAPASTHGLIQHEVLPHGRKKRLPSPLENAESPNTDEHEENCCVKYGRFLHSHVLELLILVAFCAGLPAGIVIQATRFYATEHFRKYYVFFGSTMLPMILSTLTPLLVISSMLSGVGNLTCKALKRFTSLVLFYFLMTTVTAIGVGIMFSIVLNPAAPLLSVDANSTNLTTYKDGRIIIGVAEKGESMNVYYTENVKHITATDEILSLLLMFFPGCGAPTVSYNDRFCNLFVLTLFAGLIGIGASIMNLEGGPIRHVLSQIGMAMSNMADILLWYVPIGIFFITSELVATQINWISIGYDLQPDKTVIENATTNGLETDLIVLHRATQRFMLTVLASIAVHCFVLMPIVACLVTLSRPCAGMSFRVSAPLIASFSLGFSDLCIPLTLRSLLNTNGLSRCCRSRSPMDRRIVRASAVLGGIFNRAGTAILLTCSAMFLARIEGRQLHAGSILLVGVSSMITSVTSPTGRWFNRFNPYMRGIVINLSTAGLAAPGEIPEKLLCFWAMCRVAALADTFVDALGAHVLHHYCKSSMKDVGDCKEACQDENSTDSSTAGIKMREISPASNTVPARSASGDTSDYEEAPLLFSRSAEGGNESSSMNSRNDDVFLPNRPQETRPFAQQQHGRRTNNHHQVRTAQNGDVSFVTF